MTASARRQVAGSPRQTLLSIGQVLAKLTPEFSELSPSKLRFLEDRQLVSPKRTPAGYRTYCASDVERLRFVLTVQRDHYLPLRVIKKYLDDLDAGQSPSLPNGAKATGVVKVNESLRFTRQEMVDHSGASAGLLDGAVSSGLIEAKKVYLAQDLVILKSVVDASRFGVEPRHLRGMGLAVDREMGLVSQAVSASTPGSKSMTSEEFREKARELSDILMSLRSVLTRERVQRLES
ncbi:MAG: DNA-binding transcriptional MerR regulator [Pontimonas sp.]|jgi:DNA-binding transcriptional MerR regulator